MYRITQNANSQTRARAKYDSFFLMNTKLVCMYVFADLTNPSNVKIWQKQQLQFVCNVFLDSLQSSLV